MTRFLKKTIWKTRIVPIGNVDVGGTNPVRIQSMTTSNTRDVPSTVDQILRLADVGCEIVRVTVQGMKEAEACEHIKNALIRRGCTIPLVADIHFFPPAALRAADCVDKVRINPGNYADKRASFQRLEYDDTSYAQELEKIEEKFAPLVEKCKHLKRALRIGTNHGSLSDRIMNRYGDTPKGMVESALEFARICRAYDYHDFLFSMKSSNPKIMIQAYRLLVDEMLLLGWDYPLHLGVTEAGEGEDGRIKSAMGIGSLLLEGIGDTIRVSLTEDPCNEIDPCKRLMHLKRIPTSKITPKRTRQITVPKALHRNGTVVLAQPAVDCIDINTLTQTCDVITIHNETPEEWSQLKQKNPSLIILSPQSDRLEYCRKFFDWIYTHNILAPVILHFTYSCSKEDLIIQASAEYGSLFCDGLGEGLWIDAPYDPEFLRSLSLGILQAARMRMSKTDFISCPGCGRTLFDLQEVSKRIRLRTAHLPGVKIAIMGCIVNGPGEMADADFGYVGSKPGMIDLFAGKTCVEKNIPFAQAEEKLVELIKNHGRWTNPDPTKEP